MKISLINNVSLYNVKKTTSATVYGLHPKNCSKGNAKQGTKMRIEEPVAWKQTWFADF